MTEELNLISFSPEIASSIGLEESIIFRLLEINDLGLAEIDIEKKTLFLNDHQRASAIIKLEKLGLIVRKNSKILLKKQTNFDNSRNTKDEKKSLFKFSEDILNQAKSFGMSENFIKEKIILFQSFSKKNEDSAYNSDYKLLKFLIKEWRKYEQEEIIETKKTLIKKDWEPSEDGLFILESAEIDESFVRKSIPEFILYWQEKKMKSDTWNSLFIKHVRRQWARYKNIIEDNTSLKKMSENWLPHQNCLDVLKLARIDENFVKAQIPEFKIYWIDSNQVMASWNSKFIQHVKYKWFKENPKASGIISRLTDKEWAIEYSD